jgi:hypothetical protein
MSTTRTPLYINFFLVRHHHFATIKLKSQKPTTKELHYFLPAITITISPVQIPQNNKILQTHIQTKTTTLEISF